MPEEIENTEATESTENHEQEVSGLNESQLREELSRVRRESAARRIELRDLKQKADEWDKYQQSQLTEAQKLQQRVEEAEKRASEIAAERDRVRVQAKYGFSDEDMEFLTASEPDKLEDQAKKLQTRLGSRTTPTNPVDLMAGNRGTPVGQGQTSFDDLIRASARRQ